MVKDHQMPEQPTSCHSRTHSRRIAQLMLCFALTVVSTGCINSLVMVGKMMMGDPVQTSGFELATGISLEDENKRILIHCTAPSYVQSEYDSLTADLQDEVIRRMKRRGMAVLHPDAAANILDANGGTFDPDLLARKMPDVDYIMVINVNSFQFREEHSPNLFRGRTSGSIVGYEVIGEDSMKSTLRVYDQEFRTTHPTSHPVTTDQMPQNVFIRRFIDQIADDVGSSFYRVSQGDLFAR